MSDFNALYPYITEDNRTNKQSYMYSAYHGTGFLCEYWSIRQKTMCGLADICPQAEIPASVSEVVSVLEQLAQVSPLPFVRQAPALLNDDRLERFVHSFEIHKRVFPEYDAEDRPADRMNYGATAPYVVLAAVLGLAITRNHRLKYLNALIKLSDTISSFAHELDDSEARLFLFALRAEMDAVRELMEQKGIQA